MFKQSMALISMLMLSAWAFAGGTQQPFYPEPYLNSGVQIVDVEVKKTSGGQQPEQHVMPMIPPDHVLVGVGMYSCSATMCGVWLHSRPIIGKGVLGAMETHKFGYDSDDAAKTPQHQWYKNDSPIAIVGIAVRVARDKVSRIDLTYRTIGSDGNLSSGTTTVRVGSTGSLDKSISVTNSNQVITGIGASQASSAVSALWIYQGTYL